MAAGRSASDGPLRAMAKLVLRDIADSCVRPEETEPKGKEHPNSFVPPQQMLESVGVLEKGSLQRINNNLYKKSEND